MRVVLEFPQHEKRLLRDEDGSLYVRQSDGRALPVEVDRPMSLLPLLEQRRDMYPADVIATLPIRDLLIMALGWRTDGWPSLAVEGGWITAADLADPDVHAALGTLASDRRRSQPLQHAARRILKAADLPRMP